MLKEPSCVECGKDLPGSHIHRKYCSSRCKGRWRKKNDDGLPKQTHKCRFCGMVFPIGEGQGNKWLCSPKCRRGSMAKSARTFHLRRPAQQAIYRKRTNDKNPPDSSARRFRRVNPNAPMACESCGERRVLEVAHKPSFNRLGERRSAVNCKWPEMVWVLCPTCHRLIDRMRYTPESLGLKL